MSTLNHEVTVLLKIIFRHIIWLRTVAYNTYEGNILRNKAGMFSIISQGYDQRTYTRSAKKINISCTLIRRKDLKFVNLTYNLR